MPLWVWKDRNFSLLMATFCLGFAGFSSISFWLSLYLQEVKHRTALEITVRLLPMVVSGVSVNVVCGLILHRVSNKLLTGIAALAYTASFLILSFMNAETTYWAFIFPALLLVVVGADIQFNVTNMYVMSSLPPSQQSIAGGIFNTVNKLCNNLGLGISTSVYNSVAAQMTADTPRIRPYLSVYWFAAAAAGLSLVFVPFLTLGMQGGDDPVSKKSASIADGSERGEVGQAEKGTVDVASEKAALDESATKYPGPDPVDGESHPKSEAETEALEGPERK